MVDVVEQEAVGGQKLKRKQDRTGRKQDRSKQDRTERKQDRTGRKQERSGRIQESGAAKRRRKAVIELVECLVTEVEKAAEAAAVNNLAANTASKLVADSVVADSAVADSVVADYSMTAVATHAILVNDDGELKGRAAGGVAHSIGAACARRHLDDYEHDDGWGSDLEVDADMAAAEAAQNAFITLYHGAADAEEAARVIAEGVTAGLTRPDADCDWHPFWFVEPMVSDYEVKRLRNIVANEQGLLHLNLIPSSQLSSSVHNLSQALLLQASQQELLYEKIGRAVAARVIMHAMLLHQCDSA